MAHLPSDAACANCRAVSRRRGEFCSCPHPPANAPVVGDLNRRWRPSRGVCSGWQRSPASWSDLGLLRLILEFRQTHAYPPTLEELRQRAGHGSKSTVHGVLVRLAAAGYVRRKAGAKRALAVVALPADWPAGWPGLGGAR